MLADQGVRGLLLGNVEGLRTAARPGGSRKALRDIRSVFWDETGRRSASWGCWRSSEGGRMKGDGAPRAGTRSASCRQGAPTGRAGRGGSYIERGAWKATRPGQEGAAPARCLQAPSN